MRKKRRRSDLGRARHIIDCGCTEMINLLRKRKLYSTLVLFIGAAVVYTLAYDQGYIAAVQNYDAEVETTPVTVTTSTKRSTTTSSTSTTTTTEKRTNTEQKTTTPGPVSLSEWSASLPPSALVVDPAFLRQLNTSQNPFGRSGRVKIAVDMSAKVNVLSYSDKFDIIFYNNSVSKDFVVFEDDVRRGVPRSVLSMPKPLPDNPGMFLELWERSRIIDCLNLTVTNRNYTGPLVIHPDIVFDMARFRDEMFTLGVIVNLGEGTLLGWYRECGLIPHTTDLDLYAPAEHFNEAKYEQFKNMKTAFMIFRSGRPDSIELKFHLGNKTTNTDVFILYTAGNESYVEGTAPWGERSRFMHPRLTFCSAIFYDHLFVIPCNVADLVEYQYGPNWRLDTESRNFQWDGVLNKRSMGYYTKEEMKKVYMYRHRNGKEEWGGNM